MDCGFCEIWLVIWAISAIICSVLSPVFLADVSCWVACMSLWAWLTLSADCEVACDWGESSHPTATMTATTAVRVKKCKNKDLLCLQDIVTGIIPFNAWSYITPGRSGLGVRTTADTSSRNRGNCQLFRASLHSLTFLARRPVLRVSYIFFLYSLSPRVSPRGFLIFFSIFP